jgi:NADH:ubiquinone oxidoreductase subunit 2 (subunit N)
MSLLPILILAVGGAIAVAVAGPHGSRGRVGTVIGILALAGVLAGALTMAPTGGAPLQAPEGAGAFDRLLRPSDYLRLAVALWSGAALVLVALAALVGGLPGLLVAALGGLAAGIVALGSADPTVAAGAGAAAGLAGLALIGHGHPSPAATAAITARELRMTVVSGVAVLAGVLVAPAAGAALLASGGGSRDGAAPAAAATIGLAALAIALGVAIRAGAVPFHLRVPRLTDAVPAAALPMLLVWGVVPLAAVALATADATIAPLALALDGERAIVLGIAVLALVGGAVAAWIRDDLRHLVGYLVIADTGFVLLGLAALDPAAWAPARVWLLVFATSKTALAAWLAVTEARFETRGLGDLRGWARRAPILAVGFIATAVGTFGVPGWVAWSARMELPALAAGTPLGAPMGTILALAGFLTLPVYLRVLLVGLERPASRVAGAPAERFLPLETRVRAGTGTRDAVGSLAAALADAVRRNVAPLTSILVLVLAVLAVLTAWGWVDLAGAAAQPAPAVNGPPAG